MPKLLEKGRSVKLLIWSLARHSPAARFLALDGLADAERPAVASCRRPSSTPRQAAKNASRQPAQRGLA